MAINLTVNGKTASVDVAADTPLLWVLRDTLNLHGTKFGCGIGQCGACTVHVNGQPMRSCSLQVAWREVDVPQCGYCQAGQIMSAAALLSKTPKPTDQQIDAAMDGNLCRCGTYVRVREAIHKASVMISVKGAA